MQLKNFEHKYCSECRKTTWQMLREREGEQFYVCVGNPKQGEVGCLHYHPARKEGQETERHE